MKRQFRCFRTAINVGLAHSRVDVLGIRDIGGELSGDVETIAIEVKRGTEAFATASGQALGYRVYANRVYLADVRKSDFDSHEIEIASYLGIGLVQINGTRCREVLSSPFRMPIPRLALKLIECLALGKCQLCGTFFEIGSARNKRYSRVARESFHRAMTNDRGIIFWNRELAHRKHKLGIRVCEDGSTFERRFLCPDCVKYLLSELARAK